MRRVMLLLAFLWAFGFCREPLAAFYFADSPNRLPSCQNPVLLERVLAEIKKYQEDNPPQNIKERRKQQLLLKNLNGFIPVDSRVFTSKDEPRTANRLITVKINRGLDDSELVLCKSSGRGEKYNIYLLVYPDGNEGYIVDILNFVPIQIGMPELSFSY